MSAPDILLLTIDTLRADILGCYGYGKPISPFLDELAAGGVRFEQAITGGSWTQAAFPPLLTSSSAALYGGCLGPLSPLRPSPVEALSDHGYFTFGLSSSPLLSRRYGYDRGFAVFQDLSPGETDPGIRRMRGGQLLLQQPWVHAAARLAGKNLRPARLYVSADELNARALAIIREAGRPFFGWIHYMDVHWPYHRAGELEAPDEIAQAWKDVAHLHRVNWKNAAISPAQKAHYLELYERAVRYADSQVRSLVEALQAAAADENLVLIVVSDHGEELLERGRWGHFETNLHDEIVRVPLIFRFPGGREGRAAPFRPVVRRQVSTLDILPTVLELCGCPPPAGLEGRSLAGLWSGEREQPVPPAPHSAPIIPAISEMWRGEWHIVAIRTAEHKFIWDSRRPDAPRLYDLAVDPGEREDVAAHFPDIAARFRTILDRHLDRAAATAPDHPAAAPALDDEMVRRLQALGYLE